MNKVAYILSWLLVLYAPSLSVFADTVYQNSKKLEDELFVYDADYQKLVPIINHNVNTVHFYLNTKLYKDQYVHFNTKSTIVIFVNNKLFTKVSGAEYVNFQVNEIEKFASSDNPLITVYSPQKLSAVIQTISICGKIEKNTEEVDHYKLIPRGEFAHNQSTLLVIVLIFVFFLAMQKNLSSGFFEFVYNPLNMLKDPSGDDMMNIARLDSTKALFMMLDITIISFCFLVLRNGSWQPSLFPAFLVNIFYLFLLFTVKYIYNQIIAFVFRLSTYSYIQYFQFIRLSMLFTIFILVFYLVFASPFTIFNFSGTHVFNILLISSLSLYIIKVIFSLKKVINLRSFYFISYICISEIIPVILFLVYYFLRIDKGIS